MVKSAGNFSKNDDAVVEILSEILLTAIIVIAVGAVAVFLLASLDGQDNVRVDIKSMSDTESNSLYFKHTGGEAIDIDKLEFMVDVNDTYYTLTPHNYSSDKWYLGDTIQINVPENITTDTKLNSKIVHTGASLVIFDARMYGTSGYIPGTGNDNGGNGGSGNGDDEETPEFGEFITDENVFVYGNLLKFNGNSINGPGATIVLNGDDLSSNDINGGASIGVSNIYVDGDVDFNGGSAGLGSQNIPGLINITGDLKLWNGTRDIYGDVYVDGDFELKDARLHGKVYVNGNLELGNTPWLSENSYIYYTGEIDHPGNYDQQILDKCIKQSSVPEPIIPEYAMPDVKPDDWYDSNGYVSGGNLVDDVKIFTDSYSVPAQSDASAENIIIVAAEGDISFTKSYGTISGVLFAPKGKVTFKGSEFEGVVIARDGFEVTSGGSQVTFKNIDQYIVDPEDYPF